MLGTFRAHARAYAREGAGEEGERVDRVDAAAWSTEVCSSFFLRTRLRARGWPPGERVNEFGVRKLMLGVGLPKHARLSRAHAPPTRVRLAPGEQGERARCSLPRGGWHFFGVATAVALPLGGV
jgi:hypothetical protein